MVSGPIKEFFNKHGKLIIRIGGIIGILIAAFSLASGIYFLTQDSTSKDSDYGKGYFSTWNFEIHRDSCAIVLEPDGIEFDGNWDMGEIGSFKILADTIDTGKGVFIGVAPVEAVRSYLDGVKYDKITDLRIFPAHAKYRTYSGGSLIDAPVLQGFWSDTQFGSHDNELIWNPEQDDLSLVLMNVDGSMGIDMDIHIKTMVGILFIAGAVNILVGVFCLLLGLAAIFYAGRTPNVVYPVPLGMLLEKKAERKAEI